MATHVSDLEAFLLRRELGQLDKPITLDVVQPSGASYQVSVGRNDAISHVADAVTRILQPEDGLELRLIHGTEELTQCGRSVGEYGLADGSFVMQEQTFSM